jgi:hypothetical protein
MAGSINQPWGITDKFVSRYGKVWANTDFVTNDIHQNEFRNDPMNTQVGALHVGNIKIPMKFKHVISESSKMNQLLESLVLMKPKKDQKFSITILNKTFELKKHEITRIAETLETAVESIPRGYQLGLYV